jgi:hypothetical protein
MVVVVLIPNPLMPRRDDEIRLIRLETDTVIGSPRLFVVMSVSPLHPAP